MASIREEVPVQDTMTNGDAKGEIDVTIETDLLIVGAGPAGASLASFLATHHGDPAYEPLASLRTLTSLRY